MQSLLDLGPSTFDIVTLMTSYYEDQGHPLYRQCLPGKLHEADMLLQLYYFAFDFVFNDDRQSNIIKWLVKQCPAAYSALIFGDVLQIWYNEKVLDYEHEAKVLTKKDEKPKSVDEIQKLTEPEIQKLKEFADDIYK